MGAMAEQFGSERRQQTFSLTEKIRRSGACLDAAVRCVKEMFGERRRRSQGLYYSDFRYVTICQRSSSGR
jgi:hypothetical protein